MHLIFSGATTLCLFGAAYAAALGTRPSTVVLFVAVAMLPYAGMLYAEPPTMAANARRRALLLTCLVGGAMLLAPPVLSDDVYRYVWEGRVWAHGSSPYRYAPDHPELYSLRDAGWDQLNNRSLTTIYPPLAQALFWLAYKLTGSILGFKLLALGAHLAIVGLLGKMAGAQGSGAVFAFGLNPLAVTESAMNGHVDVFVGLLLLACAWALVDHKYVRAGAFAVSAIAIKLVGFVALPLFLRTRWTVFAATVGLAMLVVAPLLLISPAGERRSGLEQYALRWRGNAGAYELVEAGVGRAIDHIDVTGIMRRFDGTPWDPRRAVLNPKKEVTNDAAIDRKLATTVAARALVVFAVLALGLGFAYRRTDALIATRWVLLFGLLLAPQVHPWYLLWLLPLEVALGRFVGLVWSAAILVSYLPLDLWFTQRIWLESTPAVLFEYGAVAVALIVEVFGPRNYS